MCINTDGKELWKTKLASGRQRFMRGEGNNASPSPCTDGKHVWVYVGTGDLGCYDFDGKEVWKFNVQDRYGKFRIQHGMHTTPLLDGDRLYMQLIHSNGQLRLALDKATGKEIWKVMRKSDGRAENEHSYASPVIWRKGKDAYLITHGNDYAIAHRLEDGSEIWRVGGLNPKDHYRGDLRFVASPVATPDLIVIPSAKDHGVVGLKPDAEGLVMPGSKYEQWRLQSRHAGCAVAAGVQRAGLLVPRERLPDLPGREDRQGAVQPAHSQLDLPGLAVGGRRQNLPDSARRRVHRGQGRPDVRAGRGESASRTSSPPRRRSATAAFTCAAGTRCMPSARPAK